MQILPYSLYENNNDLSGLILLSCFVLTIYAHLRHSLINVFPENETPYFKSFEIIAIYFLVIIVS
jgi:hypothetical protein